MTSRETPTSLAQAARGWFARPSGAEASKPWRRVGGVVVIGLLALGLAGCDKCGDWFWIDGSAPHSCKDAPQGN